jgi:hypothetical protein
MTWNLLEGYKYFYWMRSKLETSLAELHKLKNQIRVELNQIRPCGPPLQVEKRDHSTKRIFSDKFYPTDIVNPSAEKSQQEGVRTAKRFYDTQSVLFSDSSRSTEKKHFGRHYSDSISLENTVRKRVSPYFSIKPSPSPSPSPTKYDNTSLSGIGLKDKSTHLSSPRPCIRVYHNRETAIY